MFISFEGGEGAGKSTQLRRLAARLRAEGRQDVLETREPGGSLLGQELRRLVLHPPQGVVIEDRAELLVMVADRAQHVAQILRPHLEAGGIVLCDRYTDSSVAYQGYGRGLDIGEIVGLNAYATDGLTPNLTFLLDLDPAVGLARQKERSRMELEALPFHQRVRSGFLALAERHPERFCVLDAARPPVEVHEDIWARVSQDLLPTESAMKLIIAIAHERDKHKLADALLRHGLTFTKLGSTGGFLRQGNVTVLIGVNDEAVDDVLGVLREACGATEEFVNVPGEVAIGTAALGAFSPHPVKVEAGGAVALRHPR